MPTAQARSLCIEVAVESKIGKFGRGQSHNRGRAGETRTTQAEQSGCADHYDSRDRRHLASDADLHLREEPSRAVGVADVAFLGNPGPSEQLHIKIDRERLARFGLTAAEVSTVANEQLAGTRRQIDPDQLGNVAVKSTKEGQTIKTWQKSRRSRPTVQR